MSVLSDFRLARRLIAKSPVFTAVVVITLAVGIGLNTAAFSAIDALLLRPLPGVSHPDELVQVYRSWPGGLEERFGASSIPHYFDLRERSRGVFTGVAAWTFQPVSVVAGAGRPELAMGMMVSANYFSVLGVRAQRGRLFLSAEDSGRGAHSVAVLSDAGWRTLFGADPGVVDRTVVLNGRSWTIVGVAQPEFRGIISVVAPALFVPLVQYDQIMPGDTARWNRRGSNFLNVVARLQPGVTVEVARDRMDALVAQLRTEYPGQYRESGINLVRQADVGIHPMFKRAEVGLSAAVMAVVALLLLIACVNVANLFLARARDRAREMAIRLSLGASRGALVRQLVTDSLVFAALGGVAGLAVAAVAIRVTNGISLPFDIAFSPGLRLSPAVLVFALAATIATALLFGLAPALVATRPSLIPALKGETPAGESRARGSRGLVVVQMALSLVLLVCAGLFLRNLQAAIGVDKGFRSDNLLIANLEPALQGYDRARATEFYRRLLERLESTPGVEAAAISARLPLTLSESDTRVEIPGYVPSPNEGMSIQYTSVSGSYFEAMGIPVLQGRAITAQDDSAAAPVLVVNQRFVERFFRGRDPIGQVVRTGGRDRAVIGVVPTGKYQRLGETPTAYMYFPHQQRWESGMVAVVRTTGDPAPMAATFRAVVAELDPAMPLSNLRTMESALGIVLLPARLTGSVLGVFGLLGLLLSCVGVYGVMAHSVSQRTREIGIRAAVGAATGDVVGLVMRQGLRLALVGLVVGLAGAFGASRLLRGVLYGGGESDPLTFGAVPLVLLVVATLATWIPARRAGAVDPVVALRQE
jgi:predicted permease